MFGLGFLKLFAVLIDDFLFPNEVLNIRTVTIGLVDRVHIHPREVFADPITDRASAVIIAHNHPSDDVTPSEEDKKLARHLEAAGKFLGIQVLDHIIIFSQKVHYEVSLDELRAGYALTRKSKKKTDNVVEVRK